LLYPVCITMDSQRRVSITAPDFDGLSVTDPDKQRALTRIHLLMEGAASRLLIDSASLPAASEAHEIKARPAYSDCEVLGIDINPVHLAAVALHQAGHPNN